MLPGAESPEVEMKKSYGYVSRNRVTNDGAQGRGSSSRYAINSSTVGQPVAASMIPAENQPAQSSDDIDRQLSHFFKEHE